MKLQPLNDKIVIKREEAGEKTSSGLYLPSGAQEKPRKGKVIALGQGKYLENGKRSTFQVKEGDKVLFSSYAGSEVKLGDDEYLIMAEDDILAVVN